MANKLFGTDGVRGVANTFPMTAEFAFRLGQVLSDLICTGSKRVAIAKDTRVSSYMLESALIAGFTSMGVDVVKMRVVPTPLITSQIQELDVDMGVMITASHNPYSDNGIKLIDRYGDKFSDEWSSRVEELLISDRKFIPSKDAIGKVYKDKTSVPTYMENVLAIAPTPDALSGLRLVVDCANGAFSKIIPQIFKSLGAGIITLANTPDGYNINKDCGSQHTENLSQIVVQSHAHLGIAVDGDGDRIIVVDNLGHRIDGDQIIAFLATYLNKHGKLKNNAVVATVWSNLGLEKYLHNLGIDFYRTPVGERYVIEKMRATGACLGGEESGHMVLSDYTRTGDALIAGLVVCLGLLEDGRKAADIFPVFNKCPCLITNIRFENADEVSKVFEADEVKAVIEAAQEQIAPQGSIIVRKSGTEPVIKVRVEGEIESFVQSLSQKIVSTIEAQRG
ncbi:MAG TPA: phosphoglucosamine mutase [Alphaproteobacteria bacterium]|nr:phosphoglucosamine mutase [Alphaproteobacteria bacterium]